MMATAATSATLPFTGASGGGVGLQLGLLTTVAQLPHNYKIRYITAESPLDLSVKTDSMTPPLSPTAASAASMAPTTPHLIKIESNQTSSSSLNLIEIKREITPKKQSTNRTTAPPRTTGKNQRSFAVSDSPKSVKHKAVRKLKFDEKKSSPVSGTIIRTLEDIEDGVDGGGVIMESGDIDPEFNVVEVTEEAKAEIAAIPNVIGGYACKLCRNEFEDAFGLARHRCSCIVLLEYRCPECGKRFNCPANLASHRRWHKPKESVVAAAAVAVKKVENAENDQQFPCAECGKHFKRAAYLRKHMMTHSKDKAKVAPAAVGGVAMNGLASSSSSSSSSPSKKVKHNSEYSGGSYASSSENSNSADETVSMTSVGSRGGGGAVGQPTNSLKRRAAAVDVNEELALSSYSSLSKHFRMFEGAFTEEENMAAAVLAHLRNGPSVIQHTTALSI